MCKHSWFVVFPAVLSALFGLSLFLAFPSEAVAATPTCDPAEPDERAHEGADELSLERGRRTMSANGQFLTFTYNSGNKWNAKTVELNNDGTVNRVVYNDWLSKLDASTPGAGKGIFNVSASADHTVIAFTVQDSADTNFSQFWVVEVDLAAGAPDFEKLKLHENNLDGDFMKVSVSGHGSRVALMSKNDPDNPTGSPSTNAEIWTTTVTKNGMGIAPSLGTSWEQVNLKNPTSPTSFTAVNKGATEQGPMLDFEGRFVAFWGLTGSQSNVPKLYRRDLSAAAVDDTTACASTNDCIYESLAPPNAQDTLDFAFSLNGQVAAFPAVGGGTSGDVYVWMAGGEAEAVLLQDHGTQTNKAIEGGGAHYRLALNHDGRYLAFSYANISLFPTDTAIAILDCGDDLDCTNEASSSQSLAAIDGGTLRTQSSMSILSPSGNRFAVTSASDLLSDGIPEICQKGSCDQGYALYLWNNCLLLDVDTTGLPPIQGTASVVTHTEGDLEIDSSTGETTIYWIGTPEIDDPGGQNEDKNAIELWAICQTGCSADIKLADWDAVNDVEEYTGFMGSYTWNPSPSEAGTFKLQIKSGNYESQVLSGTITVD